MAASKTSESRASDSQLDEAQAESAQASAKEAEAAQEKGYFGETHSPFENDEFSLRTGPDSPTALDQEIAVHEARVEALKNSRGDNS